MTKKTLEQLATELLAARDNLESVEAAYEEKIASLKAIKDAISADILSEMNAQGLDSARTPIGTLSKRVTERFGTTDWDAMYDFIQKHNAPQVLEKRIHVSNMRQFLDENPEVEPEGLNVTRNYTVTLRKPSKTAKDI
jgi:hypothetical protein